VSADVTGRAGWDLGQLAGIGRGPAHGRGARKGGDDSAQARPPARGEASRVCGDSALTDAREALILRSRVVESRD
jgi:hypothetical protein